MVQLMNQKIKTNNYQLIITNYKCINYKHLNRHIQNNNKLINYINNKYQIFNYFLIKSQYIIIQNKHNDDIFNIFYIIKNEPPRFN